MARTSHGDRRRRPGPGRGPQRIIWGGPCDRAMAVAETRAGWLTEESVEALSSSLHESPPLAEARRKALRAFRELPMEPNPLYRNYGYFAGVDLTGLDPVGSAQMLPAPAHSEEGVHVVHDAHGTRVHVGARLQEAGVRAVSGPALWSGSDGAERGFRPSEEAPLDRLTALAEASLNRGFHLEVPARCPVPVRLQEFAVLSRPHEALSVRRNIRVGDGSHLLGSEEVYSTPGGGSGSQQFFGSDTDLEIGADARVALLSVHAPGERVVSSYRRRAVSGAGARLAWVWTGFGGYRTRIRNRSFLAGNGSDVSDLQTFFGVGEQAYDSAVDLVHQGTDTHGQSISRGVFRDQSRGMMRGLVRIEKEARKTLSFLSEHSMLLSRGTRSDAIPVLEILCRDVKATHSSSVAPVDPERVFYLESRGIAADDAVRMIAEGFLSHVLERSPIGGLRELAYPFLAARWEGRSIEWRAGAFPTLPAMELTGTEGEPDWRFDAKLR